jgi:tetratricopeptide (TPR) repeat protein
MNEFKSELYHKAIHAAKQGDTETARNILAGIVREEPQDPHAWYLLSQVIGDHEKAIFCLEQVIKIDPNNTKAKKRLEMIKSSFELNDFKNLATYLQDKTTPSRPDSTLPPLPQEKGGYGTLIWLIVIILVVLCCLCGISGFVFSERISSFVLNNFQDQMSTAPTGSYSIKYRVEGLSDSAIINYTDAFGNFRQETADLAWETTFRNEKDGTFILSAQNSFGSETITCLIYLDGEVWQQNKSNSLLPMCNVILIVGGE